MSLYQTLNLTLIAVLVFMVLYRGRRIKKLETERSVLDLRKFKSLYNYEALMYGDANGEVIVNTCIRTAEDLDVKITVHQELDEEIKKEEKCLLGDIHDPLAVERLNKLRHLHFLLP